MTGEMRFALLYIRDMLNLFRRLELSELGLLMRIVLENCVSQAPIKRDHSTLSRFLGCKSNKSFDRLLKVLIENGAVLETEEGIMACLAANAIEHFQAKSLSAKQAAASRKDRQESYSRTNGLQQDVTLSQGKADSQARAADTHPNIATKEDDDPYIHPLDYLVKDLQKLAMRKGHFNLAELLNTEEAQRLVETWIKYDVPPAGIIAKVTTLMNNKGAEQISSWKYFDAAIRAIATQSNQGETKHAGAAPRLSVI